MRSTLLAIAAMYVVPASSGCWTSHIGTYPDGFATFPARPITPAEAVEKARPHLESSIELRRSGPSRLSVREPQIVVQLAGNEYHVYVASDVLFGEADYENSRTGEVVSIAFPRSDISKIAVRVNARTGEVTAPVVDDENAAVVPAPHARSK